MRVNIGSSITNLTRIKTEIPPTESLAELETEAAALQVVGEVLLSARSNSSLEKQHCEDSPRSVSPQSSKKGALSERGSSGRNQSGNRGRQPASAEAIGSESSSTKARDTWLGLATVIALMRTKLQLFQLER